MAKAGKIKSQKTLPAVSKDEAPYDLPVTWAWTRLGSIGIINPRNDAEDDVEASFIPMKHISAAFGDEVGFEKRPWGEIKKGFTHLSEGDVALAKITPCFQNGKSAVMRKLVNKLGAGTTELHVYRLTFGGIISEYVLLFLKSPDFIKNGVPVMTGSAGQKRVPTTYFAETPFPLPPENEQKRIFAKVGQLMALCDDLEAKLVKGQAKNGKLLEAAVADLLAA